MKKPIFDTLYGIDVNKHTEKKGKFTYLSWAFAVAEMSKVDPNSTWEVKRFPLPQAPEILVPYLQTPIGFFVEVDVTINGVTRGQVHPVLDNRNQPLGKPNSFQINTSIQRALVKAIGLHGLGLYIYAGEDLPETATAKDGKGIMDAQPINEERIQEYYETFIELIDSDDGTNDLEVSDKIKEKYNELGDNRDEQIAVYNRLKDQKCGRKLYSSVLKGYLSYKPTEEAA